MKEKLERSLNFENKGRAMEMINIIGCVFSPFILFKIQVMAESKNFNCQCM